MKQEVFVAMTVTVVVQATFGGEGDVGGCADEGDEKVDIAAQVRLRVKTSDTVMVLMKVTAKL